MADIKIVKRNECRICGGHDLKKWLTLKDMPLTDDLRSKNNFKNEFTHNIDIYFCNDCHVSQTLDDVDYSNYYDTYNYTVGESDFANKFMRKLVDKLYSEFNLKKNSKVVEIGSSDGKQLSYFKKKGARVFGFEPSKELCALSREKGVSVYQGLFEENSINDLPSDLRKVDVVLLTYTFDHMPEPKKILLDIKKILDTENGILVLEIHDLKKILERKEYCLFEHEHTIYMSTETLERTLDKYGFELVTTDLLNESERRGNSLLAVIKLKKDNSKKILENTFMDSFDTYEKFESELRNSIDKLDQFVIEAAKKGKTIAGFGAGGRGVMTLAAMKSSKAISYICDNNIFNEEMYTPKTHIKIVSPLKLVSDPVDILIVFSYGYIDEIRKQVLSLTKKDIKIVSLLDLLMGKN
ncbi:MULTISPECIES: class I SAM-dependent methyltransferase [Clostridium]|uniref:class I SAM-dependent methyltransferase n=1 Tax=Clostridium TaxID=1485 RepID=UPI000B2B918D|nr:MULTISPECIES: class I SAM-dependent methyltransferase [Clostridium]